jgi:putative photosynthetic complex assembly protein
MTSHSHEIIFPKTALYGAFSIVIFSLVVVGSFRLMGGIGVDHTIPVSLSRQLWFDDRADGGINVLDARDQKPVAELQPGTNGFLRAVLRGMVHERHRLGLVEKSPFTIALWADGRLTVEDPQTHRVVELKAFGPDNSGAFERLLSRTGADS